MSGSQRVIKEAVETIVKPVGLVMEGFNFLMRQFEDAAFKKEKVQEVDGFVDSLINEAGDVERGTAAFFSEVLFIHDLNDALASLESDLALVDTLGRRTHQFLKPHCTAVYLKRPDGRLLPAFRQPDDAVVDWTALKDLAAADFDRGEAVLYENKKIGGRLFSILSLPLRTTAERLGVLLVVRKSRKEVFRQEETSLAIAGCTLISFLIANTRLHRRILRDERLVAIGKTVAGLSHDIKNILNNLEGGMDLLSLGIDGKDMETVGTAYGILRRSHERMKDLTLSMVDFARDRGPDLEEGDLNRLASEAIAAVEARAAEKGAVLVFKADPAMRPFPFDPGRLDRMLTNLLVNAIDAVETGKGRIEVATRWAPARKQAVVTVADNGCGIPESAREKVFEIFYSTKGARGTGFGLAIVEKIVREHGGTVAVESKSGKGTRFVVRLPVK